MRTGSGKDVTPAYSVIFVVVAMALLMSFLSAPGISLDSLSINFRWRTDLARLFNTVRWKAGDRLFNLSVVGSDGWFMFTGEESIADYQHTNRLSNHQLKQAQAALDALQESLQRRGSTFLVVIAPNKNTIYPQHMPGEIPVLSGDSRLDQFVTYMKENSRVQILDLRAALLEASHSEQVYYKTDTHWTAAGAYVAYAEIMKALAADHPALQPHPLSDFDRQYAESSRDLPPIMGIEAITEGNWQLVPRFKVQSQTMLINPPIGAPLRITLNADPRLPSLLIFHDSFYLTWLAEFLSPHFSRITAIPDNGSPDIWSTDWVQIQPSDIVVIELTERYLQLLFPLLGISP
jgi:hypothetical protein